MEVEDTRNRVVTEAMRLFGEQGYGATRVAQIEKAAGLSPGAGGLYRHFSSKREVLTEGVRREIQAGRELMTFISDRQAYAALPMQERLAVVALAGLRRLEQERDLNRLLVRDLEQFPDLLEQMRVDEIGKVHEAVAAWLAEQAGAGMQDTDYAAISSVFVGAISHYWLLRDIFGEHPAGVNEARYVASLAELGARFFTEGKKRE